MATVATCPSCTAPLTLPEGLADDAALLCPTCDHQFALRNAGPAPVTAAVVVPPPKEKTAEATEQKTSAVEPPSRSYLKLPTRTAVEDYGDDDDGQEDDASSTLSFESSADSGTAALSNWLKRETLTEPDEFSPTDTVPNGTKFHEPSASQPAPKPEPKKSAPAGKQTDPLGDPALDSLLNQLRGGLGDPPANDGAPKVSEDSFAIAPLSEGTISEAADELAEQKQTVEFAPSDWRRSLSQMDETVTERGSETTNAEEDDSSRIDLEATWPAADSSNIAITEGMEAAADSPSDESPAPAGAEFVSAPADTTHEDDWELTPVARPRRRRTAMLRGVGIFVGVVAGLCLGYGLLLTLGGRQYDSLGLLGKDKNTTLAAAQLAPVSSAPPQTPAEISAENSSVTAPETSPERLATYEAPAEVSPGDETAPGARLTSANLGASANLGEVEPPASDHMTPPEPASFAPPASDTLSRHPVAITGAPLYQIDALETAMVGSEQARADLSEQSLANPEHLALVGRSYAKLCEVAQVLTFLAKDSSHPSMMTERLKARDLFSRLFRYQHAREDSGQVAVRWLQWPDRPHGGIFFTGIPRPRGPMGSVHEYDVDLPSGETVTMLTPEPLDTNRFITAETVGVVGCVIETPTEKISGYAGAAPKAVWATHTIALGKSDFE